MFKMNTKGPIRNDTAAETCIISLTAITRSSVTNAIVL